MAKPEERIKAFVKAAYEMGQCQSSLCGPHGVSNVCIGCKQAAARYAFNEIKGELRLAARLLKAYGFKVTREE